MSKILVVSSNPEDLKFGEEVAQQAGMLSALAQDANDLRVHLQGSPDAVIFWDVDQALAEGPLSFGSVTSVVRKLSKPDRIFVLSDHSLNTKPFLFNDSFFNHHIRRKYEPPAAQLLSSLVTASLVGVPVGTEKFLPKGSRIQTITLSDSNERKAAVEAISQILIKLSVPTRLEALVSQAVDELLMNAIFDAPTENGEFYRKGLPRTGNFALKNREKIDLELGHCDQYFCICVRDRFGSVTKDALLKFVRKNYMNIDYKVQSDTPSAGLGIYGILKEGLSLVYMVDPDIQTHAILFIPIVRNIRVFRKSFHFWSII